MTHLAEIAKNRRKFHYEPCRLAKQRIAEFCGTKYTTRATSMEIALRNLGQKLCYRTSRPTFSLQAAKSVLADAEWTQPRADRVLKWLIASDVLLQTDSGLCVCKEVQS